MIFQLFIDRTIPEIKFTDEEDNLVQIHVVPTVLKTQAEEPRSWTPALDYMLELAEKMGLDSSEYAWEGVQSVIILLNAGYALYQWWQRRRQVFPDPGPMAL